MLSLTKFKSMHYEMHVPEDFQESFFADRHRIVKETQNYIAKHQATDSNLTNRKLNAGSILWGASTIEENYLLEQIVASNKPAVVVEIGLYRGQTALTLNRALNRHCPNSHYFGFDIARASIDITNALLTSQNFSHQWDLNLEGFTGTLPHDLHPDLVLIDGDHSFAGAALDLVTSYNMINVPGVIAIHDIGTPNWGFTHQPPGILFHNVFPKLAGSNVEISWLDSMCRNLTMRMLSPQTNARNHYCGDLVDACRIGGMTMKDTIEGWGGIGLIEKRTPNHQIKMEDIMALAPPVAPIEPVSARRSILSRALRKASELIP
jgi:predicted O-methyltransferase YrrM